MENASEPTSTLPPVAPQEQTVVDFWSFARDHIGWANVQGLFGQQQASSVQPPWMHLAGNAQDATERARLLIDHQTLELTEPITGYPDDGDLPERGDLAIVCDGNGRPVALAATLEVRVVTEGEGADTMVTETLRCLYPTAR